MKDLSLSDVTERLRRNLTAAGIEAPDSDLAKLAERGFLNAILAFEVAVRSQGSESFPDFPTAEAGRSGTEDQPESISASKSTFRGSGAASTGEALDLTIAEASLLIRQGKLSPLELAKSSLSRIEAGNEVARAFHFVRTEEALAEAAAAEAEISRSGPRGPLHGIPVAIKDIFDIRGLPTRAGTKILGSASASADSSIVERLCSAGAIIVGKTSLPEFSFSPGSNNDHFGPTPNPHNAERDAGGSSSGSASAVARGMVLGALGSDSGGSIRIPASFCGVVGWKPAQAWASMKGTAGLSWSLDTAGVLAKSVEDAVLLAAPLADRGREATSGKALRSGEGIEGLRIGVIRGEGRGKALADDDVLASWETALVALKSAGALIVDLELDELPGLRAVNSAILAIEAATLHREWQAKRLGDYGEFARLGLLAGWGYGPVDYLRARQALGALRARILSRFESIDLLCSPTMTSEATALGKPPRITFTAPFNALGWPALSFPWGTGATGLPVGVQFAGPPGSEDRIFAATLALESAGAR